MAQREPKRLECKECDYTTRSHDSLSKHNTDKHYPELFHPCQYCHYVSSDALKVRLHVTQVHVRRKRFDCKQCTFNGHSYIGRSERHLEKHIYAVHAPAEEQTQTEVNLLEPIVSMRVGGDDDESQTEIELDSDDSSDGGEDYKCHKCDFSTPMKRTLNDHKKRPHYDCEECDYSTVYRIRLTAHEKTCEGATLDTKKPKEDNKSGYSYIVQSKDQKRPKEENKSGYLYIEGEDKPYHCPHCGFDAATKNFVLRHMDRCSNSKEERTSRSPKEKVPRRATATRSGLLENDFTSSDIEIEEEIGRVAKSKPELRSTDKRPFKCPKCKLSFSDKDEAMTHSKRKHIRCADANCGFVTTHMDIYLVHMRDCLKARVARRAFLKRKKSESEDSDCEIIEEKRPKEKPRPPRQPVHKDNNAQVNQRPDEERPFPVRDPWDTMWERRAADPDPEATGRIVEKQRVRNAAGMDFFRKMQEDFAKKKKEEEMELLEKNKKEEMELLEKQQKEEEEEMANLQIKKEDRVTKVKKEGRMKKSKKEQKMKERDSDSGNETKETFSDNDQEMMQEDPAEDPSSAAAVLAAYRRSLEGKAENDGWVDGKGHPVESGDMVAAALFEVGLLEPIMSMEVGEEELPEVPEKTKKRKDHEGVPKKKKKRKVKEFAKEKEETKREEEEEVAEVEKSKKEGEMKSEKVSDSGNETRETISDKDELMQGCEELPVPERKKKKRKDHEGVPKKKKEKKKSGLPPFFRAFLKGKAEKEDPAEKEEGEDEEEKEEGGETSHDEEKDDDALIAERAPCDLCPFTAADQSLLTSHILKTHVVG